MDVSFRGGCWLQAVTAADQVSRADHPRVVPLLSNLGLVFARTARVMYAEGIYRCCPHHILSSMQVRCNVAPSSLSIASSRQHVCMCANRKAIKTLGLDPAKPDPPLTVHASVAAQLAWRYSQLLTALPQRGTEAEAWEGCAVRLYAKAGGFQGFRDIGEAFGDLRALQGQGSEGAGGVADLSIRRLLPCM